MNEGSIRRRFVRRSDVFANELSASESVMLDMDRGMYFGVQDVAKAIWDELSAPVSIEELCAALRERFEVDERTCREEVESFLDHLHRENLVEVVDGRAPS
jgi:hypothetical protein